jgi:hypothetical protein
MPVKWHNLGLFIHLIKKDLRHRNLFGMHVENPPSPTPTCREVSSTASISAQERKIFRPFPVVT